MDHRGRGDEAVFDRHSLTGGAETCQQFRPLKACVRLPGQTIETVYSRGEPTLESGPSLPLWEDQNPESQFAEDDRIDSNLRLMCPEPCNYAGIGRRFCGLAQNVGVDQILH